jgi:3,4-dihydroxy 2-butanone 4-phosphate synthase/GTP cyclohydrolase II
MALSNIQEIIEDIRQGKMVILMDDEDRENEGDILIAAEKITPDIVNFMATHGRGLICLTITRDRCTQLSLPMMVQNNTEHFGTNFTVSIEAAEGVDTGISAFDRAQTIKAATAPKASAASVVSPGHIFPVVARDGGVLVRAGHTEAGCDLARLAGLEPSCAIVEILNEDGTMARRPQLELFAQEHGIKLGTIADLIEYRIAHETIIEKIATESITTEFGEFTLTTYTDHIDHLLHYALSHGEVDPAEPVLVRVHTRDPFRDILHADDGRWTISTAMQKIAASQGVMVIVSKPESPDYIAQKISELRHINSNQPVKKVGKSREIGIGSQILHNLGIKQMKLISSSTQKYHSLSGFGLEVIDYVCD